MIKVKGAYKMDCVIRSDFDWSDCPNIDVNVRGEICISWKNETVVRHFEAASEPMIGMLNSEWTVMVHQNI